MKQVHVKIAGGIKNSKFQISGEWSSNKQLSIELFIYTSQVISLRGIYPN